MWYFASLQLLQVFFGSTVFFSGGTDAMPPFYHWVHSLYYFRIYVYSLLLSQRMSMDLCFLYRLLWINPCFITVEYFLLDNHATFSVYIKWNVRYFARCVLRTWDQTHKALCLPNIISNEDKIVSYFNA